MIYNYEITEQNLDLQPHAARHSGDETVCYKKVFGEDILLSYYYPQNYDKSKKYPAFLFIHGGGWASNQIFEDQDTWQGDHLGYLARYYADKDFISVSIDYRLADVKGQKENYQVIDSCDDCFDAVDFVLDRADEKGIDLDNVYVLGESAGGHLAAYVTTCYKREGFNFKASFPINPITDLVSDKWNARVPLKSNHKELSKMPQSEYAQFMSPLFRITEDICPVVLIHGSDDFVVPLAHSEKFHEKLTDMGKECELHIIKDTNHAFLLYEYTSFKNSCKIAISIIDKYLEV